jgi:hypothetical protein
VNIGEPELPKIRGLRYGLKAPDRVGHNDLAVQPGGRRSTGVRQQRFTREIDSSN